MNSPEVGRQICICICICKSHRNLKGDQSHWADQDSLPLCAASHLSSAASLSRPGSSPVLFLVANLSSAASLQHSASHHAARLGSVLQTAQWLAHACHQRASLIASCCYAGSSVYHGPIEGVMPFFGTLGFQIQGRKDIPTFLQEVTSRKDQKVAPLTNTQTLMLWQSICCCCKIVFTSPGPFCILFLSVWKVSRLAVVCPADCQPS